MRKILAAVLAGLLASWPVHAQQLSGGSSGGGSSGLTIGTTTITSGTTTRLIYDLGGVVQEAAGVTVDATSNGLVLTSTATGGASLLTLTGQTGVLAASQPVLNMTQTWNAAGVTFTGIKLNITNTASASGSLLLDLQKGGTSQAKFDRNGDLTFGVGNDGGTFLSTITAGGSNDLRLAANAIFARLSSNFGFGLGSNRSFSFFSSTDPSTSAPDTYISRGGAAGATQLGQADAAAPVPQIIGVQRVVAGTASGTVGALWTFKDSAGTGVGVSGGYSFQVAPAGGANTNQNTYSAALTIAGGTGLVSLPLLTSDAAKTDATVCEDTTNHSLYSGSGTLGICLGTSSERYKPYVADLDVGLAQILSLKPVKYRLDAQHGNPSKMFYGFTAEQGGVVLPTLMGVDTENRPNTFDYLGVVPVLVRAIQQQQIEIDALKNKMN